jgi:hypothetical protein
VKQITFLTILVASFVTSFESNCQTNLGKSFQFISHQKFVTEIDTSSVTKFVKSVSKSNVVVINFFDENLVSNVASLTFLSQIDTDSCIKDLDSLFVRYVSNGWKINANEVIIFEDGSFYHLLIKKPLTKINLK